MLQAKQAHWNVKGMAFRQLHELFDDVAAAVLGHVDGLAERAVQLGGTAEGTVTAVRKRSSLPDYPLAITDGKAHLEALRGSIAAFAKALRKNIDEAAAAGDADTADLFTEVSRAADEQLWLVEAHLQ